MRLHLVCALALGLCSASAAAQVAPDAGQFAPDPRREADALWARREDPAALEQLLKSAEGATDVALRVFAARAHLFRAQGLLLHRGNSGRARTELEAARKLALGALGSPKSFDGLGAEAVEPLTALAEADVALSGLHTSLEAAPLLKEALSSSARAAALAPETPAPHLAHAAALCALPSRAGGDLTAARFELEASIAAAPLLLAPRVEMAARVAVKAQDRRLFHALLVTALRLDPSTPEDQGPEQRRARVRAIGLLHRERTLFRG